MGASISSVLAHWNLGEVASIETFHSDQYSSSGNAHLVQFGDSLFVVKRLEGKSALGPMFTILPELHKRGVPVAVPVPTREGEPAVFCAGDCYYVVPFLHGSVVSDHFGPGMEQRARSFGMALARLHAALRQITLPSSPADMNLLGQVQKCEAEARAHGMSGSTIDALAETIDALRHSALLPAQLIHRDAHASNVLFTNNEVSGWLDFELTTVGPRVFDLCYYSTSLMMNALGEPERIERWLAVLGPLVSGYQEVDCLTENECALLPYVLLAIEAVFLSYCLRINDQAGVTQTVRALEWLHRNLPEVRSAIALGG